MRGTQLKKYKRLLLEKRSRLTGTLSAMADEALKPDGSSSGSDEVADMSSEQFEQELTLGLMANEHEQVCEIDDALTRVEDKSFGKCEACDAKVPKPRLDAIPWARHCIDCQSKLERFGTL